MPNGSIFVAAGTLPLVGASCWLLMCGSIQSPHRQSHLLSSILGAPSITPTIRTGESRKQIADAWIDTTMFQIKPEDLQRFIKDDARAEAVVKPAVQDDLQTASASISAHAVDEVIPMERIPLPPSHPDAPKAAAPMKRMRHALKLLSRKDRPSRSAVASALPYNARASTDAIAFFRENPPRLIDIFSIPK